MDVSQSMTPLTAHPWLIVVLILALFLVAAWIGERAVEWFGDKTPWDDDEGEFRL